MNQVVEIEHKTPQPVSEAVSFLAMIERAARDPSVDVDKFERLMLMKERVEANAARKAFNAAVAVAKGEIGLIVKNAKGHNDKAYADFAAIASVVDPVLAAHGLTYRFRTQQTDRINVTCILSHSDGHSEETTLAGPPDTSGSKNAIQAIGSTLTYLQRYSLIQSLGLAATKDDDAKSADKSLQSVVDEGRSIALKEGVIALGNWWQKTLTKDQRTALGSGVLSVLKWIAENGTNAPIDGYDDNSGAE